MEPEEILPNQPKAKGKEEKTLQKESNDSVIKVEESELPLTFLESSEKGKLSSETDSSSILDGSLDLEDSSLLPIEDNNSPVNESLSLEDSSLLPIEDNNSLVLSESLALEDTPLLLALPEEEISSDEDKTDEDKTLEKEKEEKHRTQEKKIEVKEKKDSSIESFTEIKEIKEESSKENQEKLYKSTKTLFGKVAILLGMATQDQVNDALLSAVTDHSGKKLGEIMIELGHLTPEQVDTIKSRQKTKAMVCPKCEKKYQIVLFQKGRSYKCKTAHCVEELLEWKKFKKKKKINKKELTGQMQVMGLTQSITQVSRKKRYDTAGLDFVSEQKPEEIQTKGQQGQVLRTPDILKQAGIDIPSMVSSTRRIDNKPILQSQKKSTEPGKYIFIFVFIIVAFFLFRGGSEEGEDLNTRESKSLKEMAEEKMHQRYAKLISEPVDGRDSRSIGKRLKEYRSFQIKYSQSPYQEDIENDIKKLQEQLNIVHLEQEYIVVERQIQNKIRHGEFAPALESVAKLSEKYGLLALEDQSVKLREQVEKSSQDELDGYLVKIGNWIADKNFTKARRLFQEARRHQTARSLAKLATQEKELDKIIFQEERLQSFLFLSERITYLLQQRKYDESIERLELEKTTSPHLTEDLSQWISFIQNDRELWQQLTLNLEKLRGKSSSFFLEKERRKIQARLINFKAEKESLILVGEDRKAIYVKLRELSVNNIKSLVFISKKDLSEKEKIAFSLFLSVWKPFLEPTLELKEDSFFREIFLLNLLSQSKKHLREKNLRELSGGLRLFLTFSKDNLTQKFQEELKKLIQEQKREEKLPSKYRENLLLIEEKYLRDEE